MENYIPPFEITNKMIALVSSISEKIGKIKVTINLESKPHLRKNNKIKSIHSSLKIEASSLSMSQVRDVINGHIVLGQMREIQEVKNAYTAYEMLSEINPYSISDLKRLHKIMTEKVVNESGDFRKGEEGVFNGDECIFMAPPARLVPQLMDSLFNWMKSASSDIHPLILASVFHYEFVFIHPFSDGNGRMARLWHTAILTKWNSLFEFVPLESQIEKFQNDYYDAIAKCHVAGSSNYFIEFILEQLDKILDEISLTSSEKCVLNDNIKRLLDIMEYNVPYTLSYISEKLNLKSKDAVRNNYVRPAIEEGFIRMTLPDKPKSKNQRYIRV